MLSSPRFSGPCVTAFLASAVLATATPLFAQVHSVPMRPVPPPVAANPAPPAPDPDNTGNPDDPARPLSREPGDLMSSGTMVYVDDSFDSVQALRTAIHYASQGQSQLAITSFQDITSKFGQKLVLLNDNSYVSITDYVRERLLAMPAVKNGMYDQLYGLDARRAVDDAIANRDVATLIRVCDRYFPSTAAVKGLAQAADWYFERGEFSAAALTWSKLLTHPQAADRKPEFLFRAALAEHLSQDPHDAARLRDQLAKDYADASATIAGSPVKLLGKLDELLAQPAWEAAGLASDEWPAFQGGPSRSLLLNSNAAIGAKLWSLPMADMGDAAGQSAAQGANIVRFANAPGVQMVQVDGEMMGGLGSFPVLSNGDVFVHLGNQIMALSASSGAKLWAYPNGQRDSPAQERLRRTGVNPYLNGHASASVFGDQVFAVLQPSLVVCLRRDDGSLIWSRNSSEIKTEKDGTLTFIGSPLVTRQGVFVMARKSSEQNFTPQYLVRLDRETGAPTWSCYLCSTMNVYNQGPGGNIPVPTLVDDVLYINTGQGADCAVDANVGRILWLRVTASRNTVAAGDPAQAQMLVQRGIVMGDTLMITPQVTSWKCNPPLVLGDKMLSTDSQFLRIYDRWNGKILKTLRVADLIDPANVSGTPTLDVLAGAVGGKVVMSIRNTELCFDLASLLTDKPQPEWVSNVTGAGTAEGRPFLTTSGYYIPFTTKLVRVDVKTGKAEAWDWPRNDRDEPGRPGNLLVTSEQVIVVNDQEVSGYSKWEVARDNRLARIQAAPQDPAPCLDLAEISFRTNHQDLAQANMKQAVDLANAGSVPGGSVTDMLGRLYRTNLAFAQLLLAKDDKELRDQSRFYFEQCRATARSPEQGAEWRMQFAELSRKQKKYDEAAVLYSEILADPALRAAGYHEPDGMLSAAASAERHMKDLIALAGPDVYQRFETQAAALTQRATAAHDVAALQQVVDVYPNSAAALSAASTLADICLEKQDWDTARRALWWLLQQRIDGPAQALAIAHLAQASIGLKKYDSAGNWVARGTRLFKDFSWNQGGQKLTFDDLRAQVLKVRGTELDGRLPTLPKGLNAAKMEAAPMGLEIANQYGPQLLTQLLVPVETSPALRQPNLIFIRSGSDLHIRDAEKNQDIGKPAPLPASADTVLVGATKDFAVLLQAGTAIGVDLKTHDTWKQTLKVPPANTGRPAVPPNIRQVTIGNGMQVQVVNGNWVLNGNGTLGPVDSIQIVDQAGNIILPDGGTDPESVRRAAFLPLGNAARFTTARILNGNLVILAGNQIDAFNIETGKPAWTAPGGQVITAHLPNGTATCLVGNEDMIVAQVDDPDGHSSTFCAFDAETGKAGKTLKLDNEHALWRALGDDGTLYVVTDKAVAAYDLVSAKSVWRNQMQRDPGRGDGPPRFATATALTLDGVIFVSDDNNVHCFGLESGVDRWPRPPQAPAAQLDLELTNAAGISSLHSMVIGDMVVFQSDNGSAAFKTPPQPPQPPNPTDHRDDSPQLAWKATYPNPHPLGLTMQPASECLVEFLSSQITSLGLSRADMFSFWRTVGGKLDFNPWVNLSGDTTIPGTGPQIRSWQVVDGGIVFETVPNGSPLTASNMPGTVYFWRVKAHP